MKNLVSTLIAIVMIVLSVPSFANFVGENTQVTDINSSTLVPGGVLTKNSLIVQQTPVIGGGFGHAGPVGPMGGGGGYYVPYCMLYPFSPMCIYQAGAMFRPYFRPIRSWGVSLGFATRCGTFGTSFGGIY